MLLRSVRSLESVPAGGGVRDRGEGVALLRALPFGGGSGLAAGREIGVPLWLGRCCAGRRRKRAGWRLGARALDLGVLVVELRPATAGTEQHPRGVEKVFGSRVWLAGEVWAGWGWHRRPWNHRSASMTRETACGRVSRGLVIFFHRR